MAVRSSVALQAAAFGAVCLTAGCRATGEVETSVNPDGQYQLQVLYFSGPLTSHDSTLFIVAPNDGPSWRQQVAASHESSSEKLTAEWRDSTTVVLRIRSCDDFWLDPQRPYPDVTLVCEPTASPEAGGRG